MQFTNNMKLKKKEDQSVDTSVLLRMENKILREENTKCGAESKGKTIERLPHLGIHSI
jgi:FtsZ-binding cell division protein ZapB